MRGLSLFGKVTIIKAFFIPKLLFVSPIIEQTWWYIKKVGKIYLQIFVEGSRLSYKEFSNKYVRS